MARDPKRWWIKRPGYRLATTPRQAPWPDFPILTLIQLGCLSTPQAMAQRPTCVRVWTRARVKKECQKNLFLLGATRHPGCRDTKQISHTKQVRSPKSKVHHHRRTKRNKMKQILGGKGEGLPDLYIYLYIYTLYIVYQQQNFCLLHFAVIFSFSFFSSRF